MPTHLPRTMAETNKRRIDGRVQSILVGGHDVASVIKRDDYWNCCFYEYVSFRFFPLTPQNTDVKFSNYDCKATNDDFLTIPDGVNNLGSVGWGTRIRGLKCRNFQPDMS
jgi:hypothetical protein